MLTAKEAKEIAKPIRQVTIDKQVSLVDKQIEGEAKRGNMVLVIEGELLHEVSSYFQAERHFRVWFDSTAKKTTISWY